MRVMLVEDDASLRQALSAFFRSAGAEVVGQSGDGAEALEQLISLRADLILTDCQMPRLDGIAFVRQLRARGDLTPVIMMSGQTDPTVRELALAAGVSQYLSKPLSMPTLNRAIGQAIGTAA